MDKEIPNEIFTHRSSILVDNSIESCQYSLCVPQGKVDFNVSGGTIAIDIPASDSHYYPSGSFLKIKGKLVRDDSEKAYAANTQIALINYAIIYLFSRIEYSVEGVNITFPRTHTVDDSLYNFSG